MTPKALELKDVGTVRVWSSHGNLCAVVYRNEFEDYIGSVNYDENVYVLTVPNEDLETVIDNVETFAEHESVQNFRNPSQS